MNVLEPDVSKWTPEAIAAFLASPAAEGLTAADLKTYVAMRNAARTWERCGVTAALMTKAQREARESAYRDFKQARARWAAVMVRLHPPLPGIDVQTLSTGRTI